MTFCQKSEVLTNKTAKILLIIRLNGVILQRQNNKVLAQTKWVSIN
jgi:hypothetical protein